MEALASNLLHKSEKSYTDGALGQMVKRELIIDVAPIHDEAFWLPIIQQKANEITNEAAFDAFITPHFNVALVDCGLVFVKRPSVVNSVNKFVQEYRDQPGWIFYPPGDVSCQASTK
ncbi:unnamed protein product [Aphanomyces euteiches]